MNIFVVIYWREGIYYENINMVLKFFESNLTSGTSVGPGRDQNRKFLLHIQYFSTILLKKATLKVYLF